MNTDIRDFELIEKADLSTQLKFIAQTMVASLHGLRGLSMELGIPMEQITVEHILHEVSRADTAISKQTTRRYD
jgi:hypothetical protein